MTDLLLIFFSACLVNNLVLDHMLAVDPVAAMADKIDAAADLGLAMMVLAPVVVLAGYLLNAHVLVPLHATNLQLPALMLVIVAAVTLSVSLIRRISPRFHRRIHDMTPLLLVNCALPGIMLLYLGLDNGAVFALLFGLGTAAGVLFVAVAFAALQERLAAADVPRPFRGPAIVMITLGLFSMGLMGLAGPGYN